MEASQASGAARERPKTVLVVDGERHLVRLLQVHLQREGVAVLAAYDGEDGLALLERHEVDLVVLEEELPVLSGWEFLRRIRKRPDGRPRVAFCVDDATADRMRQARQWGADAVVAKPYDPVIFRSLL